MHIVTHFFCKVVKCRKQGRTMLRKTLF